MLLVRHGFFLPYCDSGSREKLRQSSMRKETQMSVKQNMNQLQPNSVNTVTEGAVASVRINGVSVLKGLC